MVELTDSGPPPSDDIGRKRETPMNSTPDPKETEPRDAPIAGADERLAHAHEEIRRADEQLARVSEQLAKMERDDARPLPARPGPQSSPAPSSPAPSPTTQAPTTQSPPAQSPPAQSPPERPARRGAVGMLLVACFVVTALVLSAYGSGAKLVVARWAPQLVSTPSPPPESPTLAAQSAPSIVQVAAAETAPPPATRNTATGNATASNIPGPGSDRAARCRAGGCRSAPGSDPVAANHRARSRESGANHRTAQGEPAANGQRQFKSHR